MRDADWLTRKRIHTKILSIQRTVPGSLFGRMASVTNTHVIPEKETPVMEAKPKWTLMFFFAGDNNLTASMLYQLKSIKTAGFQVDTNVLVYFDPSERGVPARIFEINKTEKEGNFESIIGDEPDPSVRDLADDQVEPSLTSDPCSGYSANYDSVPADQALAHFLEFSRKNYPADQYMLFLVGHGLIVGRDGFLPDEHPNSSIGLVELGKIMRSFSKEIGKSGGKLELIGMHSCSMSAVEVAYQLKGTASYMMGSEGFSFVGAWPYRRMLQKIFNAINDARKEIKVLDLLKDLHTLCFHNTADLIFAGYSSDLCLISLDPVKVEALTEPIETLTKALIAGLNDDRCKELILLAHLKSQSYYQELYTDLYDFCLCLSESCSQSDENQTQETLRLACESVTKVLIPENGEGPILQADFFGADCQHSYGLSIYFPWTRPVEDAFEHAVRNYRNYAFVTELCGASWLDFLEVYFEKTLRRKRRIALPAVASADEEEILKTITLRYNPIAFPSSVPQNDSAVLQGKVSPADASGYGWYSVIKNYSRDFPITERAVRAFTDARRRKKRKK